MDDDNDYLHSDTDWRCDRCTVWRLKDDNACSHSVTDWLCDVCTVWRMDDNNDCLHGVTDARCDGLMMILIVRTVWRMHGYRMDDDIDCSHVVTKVPCDGCTVWRADDDNDCSHGGLFFLRSNNKSNLFEARFWKAREKSHNLLGEICFSFFNRPIYLDASSSAPQGF